MKRKAKHTHMDGFSSHFSQRKHKTTHAHEHTQAYTQYKNNTEHLKTKFFIYFVTTSYTSENFHSERTVTQDKSIWHIAIKAKTSIESSDYYCFPFFFLLKKMLDEILGPYFLKVYTPHNPKSHSIDFPSGKLMLLV